MTTLITIKSKIPVQKKGKPFTMSELAQKQNAIDLSGDYSNMLIHPMLKEFFIKSASDNTFDTTPPIGLPALRAQLAHLIKQKYQNWYDPESNISITAGATNAINAAISAFVNENDEVIVFEPVYNSYTSSILLSGGIPVYVALKENSFSIDWEQVKKAISNKTKMIVLNFPHNPTGTVLSAWDVAQLKKAIAGTDIIILSDEVFDSLVYTNNEHESILGSPELMDRSIVVSSFSKTLSISGWRIGFFVASDKISREIRKVHHCITLSAPAMAQYALYYFLKEVYNENEIQKKFLDKRTLCANMLEGSKFKFNVAKSTFFQLIDYSMISQESDVDFSLKLLQETGVALQPLSEFYKSKTAQHYLRLNFAQPNELLIDAFSRLAAFSK